MVVMKALFGPSNFDLQVQRCSAPACTHGQMQMAVLSKKGSQVYTLTGLV